MFRSEFAQPVRWWPGVLLAVMLLAVACGQRGSAGDRNDTVDSGGMEAAERDAQGATPDPNAPQQEGNGSAAALNLEVPIMVIWSDAARAPVLSRLGAEFEERYGIEVRVEEHDAAEILDNFRSSLMRQEGMPDIFVGSHDWLPLLAANGMLSPLDLSGFEGDFPPVALQAMAHDGYLYGMPVSLSGLALVFNPDLVGSAPATWTELQDVVRSLAGTDGMDIGLGINLASVYEAYPVITGFGGDLFAFERSAGFDLARPRLHEETTRSAVTWLLAMAGEGLIRREVSLEETHRLFQHGRVPFMIAGSWSLPLLEAGQTPFQVTDFPGQGRSFVNVAGYMINAHGRDPYMASIFLTQMLMNEAEMLRLHEAEPSLPAYRPVLDQVQDPALEAFARAVSQGAVLPGIPETDDIWRIWNQAHQGILVDEASVDQAYSEASQALTELLVQD